MINRVLIRIRVVQILFSYSQGETTDMRKAENELLFSLQKSYDLYFYLLSLLVELTDSYAQKVDNRKSKLLPTEEDIKPNIRLLNNKFILQLRENLELNKYLKDRPFPGTTTILSFVKCLRTSSIRTSIKNIWTVIPIVMMTTVSFGAKRSSMSSVPMKNYTPCSRMKAFTGMTTSKSSNLLS